MIETRLLKVKQPFPLFQLPLLTDHEHEDSRLCRSPT